MNKQEAIEKINNMDTFKINDTVLHHQFDMIDKYKVLGVISKINEPKKVVVPQFVDDWYENNKYDIENSIYRLCVGFYSETLDEEIYDWFGDSETNPIQTLVNMHLFGYEIEKEKLYTAMLNLSGEYLRLIYGAFSHLKVDRKYILDGAGGYRFTEDDLVKYHIWGNDNYEVKEVEE